MMLSFNLFFRNKNENCRLGRGMVGQDELLAHADAW
jgi:hypothetical protein